MGSASRYLLILRPLPPLENTFSPRIELSGPPTREGGPTFTQRVLRASEQWMLKSAPKDADTTSWRY
jgi:hypothetical protein